MQDQIKHITASHDIEPERAIVLCVLDSDHATGWLRAQLADELGLAGSTFEDALRRLCAAGVIVLSGETVCASRAAVYLDSLEMIAV
jgi:DNA-binding MarR family transcriptional regulator